MRSRFATSSAARCSVTARMRAEPELVPFAIEELLRAYAPVTMARLVARDATIGDTESRLSTSTGPKRLMTSLN